MAQCQSIFFRALVCVVPTNTLGCGFAFAFDLAATTLIFVVLALLVDPQEFLYVFNRIDHIFDRSIRNSDPRMRIVLVHGFNFEFQFRT